MKKVKFICLLSVLLFIEQPQFDESRFHYIFPDGPDKALLQNFLMIRDIQLNRIPYERLADYLTGDKTKRIADKNDIDFHWTNVESKTPGRSRSFLYNKKSNTIFIGSVTGGLWKKNDINNNTPWHYVDGYKGVSVSKIISDPQDETTMYIGTGESFTAFINYRESTSAGEGIFKSTDGGITWNKINSTSGFSFVNDMEFRIENGISALYVATGSGEYRGKKFIQEGLYKTINQGETWQQVLPAIDNTDNTYQVSDIEIASNGRIFVATTKNSNYQGGARIWYSDNGIQWHYYIYTGFQNDIKLEITNKQLTPGRTIIKVAPSNPNHVYAVFSSGNTNLLDQFKENKTEIAQSIDGGQTWTYIYSGDEIFSLPWHAMAMAIDPNNENRILIGGLDLYVIQNTANQTTSVDLIKLSNWTLLYDANRGEINNYVHSDMHEIQFVGKSSDEVLITTDGGIFHSSNMGRVQSIKPETPQSEYPKFSHLYQGLTTTQFYHASLNPNIGSKEILGGTQDNGSLYYNGTETLISGGDGGYSFFDSNDPVKITTVYGNRYFIHVKGNTHFVGKYYDGLFVNPTDYDDVSNLLYSNSATSKYGGDWYDYYNKFVDKLQIINVNKFLANGKFQDLDTSSFVLLNLGLREAISAIRLFKIPNQQSNTAIIGTENGQVYRVNGLPYNANAVKIDGNKLPIGYVSSVDVGTNVNHILVTISNFGLKKVWVTNDGGDNWINLERNLADIPVRWGRFKPGSDNEIIIATEVGIFGLEDISNPSEQWLSYNNGLPTIRVDMFDLRSSDNKILAATHGHGLFIGDYTPPKSIYDVATTIIKNNLEENTYFYPNPTYDLIKLNGNDKITVVEIYNVSGEFVGKYKLSVERSLQIGQLKSGAYIVRGLNSNNHVEFTQRIVRL